MTTSPFDLDAYFDRIGYTGPWEPTLAVLRELHRLHPAAIPFENLNPLMGAPVSLDLGDLQAKLVTGGRGGYCYEQNALFKAALSALGFQVQGLAGRVRWNMPEDAPDRPRTHMALRVDLAEGGFIVDVGFGGMVMTAPLRLETGVDQQTPHGRFRLAQAGEGRFDLQAETDGEWRTLFRFDLTPQLDADYEPMNWFTATHPTSIFPNSLMVARAAPGRRLTLANDRYTVRDAGAAPVERQLQTIDEIAEVLTADFGLTLPPGFERVAAKLGLQNA